MTEASPARWAREARRGVAPAPRKGEHVLPVRIDLPGAKVRLLPGQYRGAEYVQQHVKYVLSRDAETGETHVQRNLECIRENLEGMGIDPSSIELEVRRIEAAVRAEIWRQILWGA